MKHIFTLINTNTADVYAWVFIVFLCPQYKSLFLHKNEKCLIQNGLMQMTALPSQIDGNRTMGQGQSMGQFAPPL